MQFDMLQVSLISHDAIVCSVSFNFFSISVGQLLKLLSAFNRLCATGGVVALEKHEVTGMVSI